MTRHETLAAVAIGVVVIFVQRRMIARRLARLGQHASHLVALIAAHGPALFVWRRLPRGARRAAAPLVAIVRFITFPVRWFATRVIIRTVGVRRLVTGEHHVRVALGDMDARDGTLFAPELRTPYAPRLDSLEMWFVLGENRSNEVHHQRDVLASIVAANSERFELAVRAARVQATAAASSCNGHLDVIAGLVVPACTAAITAFLFNEAQPGQRDRALGPELFASLQLLLHRTFLNPSSPDAKADWQSMVTARAVSVKLRRQLADAPQLNGDVDALAPAMALDGELRHGSSRDALIMLATALGPHVAWVTGSVIDELLRHPSQIGDQNPWGQQVTGTQTNDRRVRLVLEAMRHNPVVPGLIRTCPMHAELKDASTTRRPLRPGSTLIYTQSMEFTRPEHLLFRPDRFIDPTSAPPPMSFGFGAHECLGQQQAMQMMVAMLDPLLCHDNVRRASSPAGKISSAADRLRPAARRRLAISDSPRS